MKPKIHNAHADKEIYNYHSKKKKDKEILKYTQEHAVKSVYA